MISICHSVIAQYLHFVDWGNEYVLIFARLYLCSSLLFVSLYKLNRIITVITRKITKELSVHVTFKKL